MIVYSTGFEHGTMTEPYDAWRKIQWKRSLEFYWNSMPNSLRNGIAISIKMAGLSAALECWKHDASVFSVLFFHPSLATERKMEGYQSFD